jgi:hypothetical protein
MKQEKYYQMQFMNPQILVFFLVPVKLIRELGNSQICENKNI